ncbi:hypothetical protein GW916_04765 [bacterium]|nr:hypothetical protein [bacterium]
MKNLNLAIISSIVLALSLSSCGGTTIEAAEGPNVRPVSSGNTGLSTLSLSSSVGEFGSMEVSTTVELIPSGGQSPYTLALLSGEGSLNSNSLTFTAASSESTVGVRVTDAAGQTAEHYFYVVAYDVDATSDTCVAMGDATRAQGGTGLEQAVNLADDSRTSAAHVMTGIGLRAKADKLYALYVKSEVLNANGSVTESPAFATTKYTDDGNGAAVEVFVEAPSGYYIYGVGAATDATGENFDLVKIYVARPNTEYSDYDQQECVLVRGGSLECGSSVSVPSSIVNYMEFAGRFNKPMTAFGAAVNGGQIDRMAAWSRDLSFVDCE